MIPEQRTQELREDWVVDCWQVFGRIEVVELMHWGWDEGEMIPNHVIVQDTLCFLSLLNCFLRCMHA